MATQEANMISRTKFEGYFENLRKAQEDVFKLCQEHISNKKISETELMPFFGLKLATDETQAL